MTIEANVSSPLRLLMPTLVSISSDLVDSVLWVRMGDERSKHAMLQQVFQDLGDLFDAVALDDEVRVVVLTGAGRRFSTGGSVTGMAERASRQEGIDLRTDRPSCSWGACTATCWESTNRSSPR